MITVLCCNAGVDRTYEVDGFALGQYHQPRRFRASPGGKGINVARVLRTLGEDVLVSGFAGGTAAGFIAAQLKRGGITPHFVEIAEESRLCINVIDTKTRSQTQVDELGPLVTPTEVQNLIRRWPTVLTRSAMAVISGSAPRGAPFGLYRELIELAREQRVPVILDAHDELLAEAIDAKPQVVKPNLAELNALMGAELSVPNGVLEASAELLARGVKIVITSLGKQGAIFVAEAGAYWATPPKIDYISAVGSGDSLVAGFAAASVQRLSFEERMQWAVAAGSANAATFGAGFCTLEQVRNILPEVAVRRIDGNDAGALAPDTSATGQPAN